MAQKVVKLINNKKLRLMMGNLAKKELKNIFQWSKTEASLKIL